MKKVKTKKKLFFVIFLIVALIITFSLSKNSIIVKTAVDSTIKNIKRFIGTEGEWEYISEGSDDKISWKIEYTTLKLKVDEDGTGIMKDFGQGNAPWYGSKDIIKKVEVEGNLKKIGRYAFYRCSSLTNVDIERTELTSIGDYAFCASGITEIRIPNSVTSIGKSAFSGCHKLTSVNLPTGITKISDGLFNDCENLSKIYYGSNENLNYVLLPEGITTIGASAFKNCKNLTRLVNLEENSITTIGVYAFSASGITKIRMPDSGVVSIGTGAFSECTGLTEVKLPSSITQISDSLFYHCENLSKVYYGSSENSNYVLLPKSITTIGVNAFHSCKNLTKPVDLEENRITTIGGYAFCSSGITGIRMPDSVTSIGKSAFSGCHKLTTVKLPSDIRLISEGLFYYCENLSKIYYGNKENSEYILLPEGIETIGANAFNNCKNLTKPVDLEENSITTIGASAFSASGITKIRMPDSGVESIGTEAFSECMGLTEVKLPSSITQISDSLFYHCENLSKVYYGSSENSNYVLLPKSITTIGVNAFHSCKNLTKPVDLEENRITTIGGYAFCSSGITGIRMPDSVTSIGKSAFSGCHKLTTVKLPSDIRLISEGLFYYCENLSKIYYGNNENSEYILLPEVIATIGVNAFNGCNKITKIYIPISVTSIGKEAFANCKNLEMFDFENESNITFGENILNNSILSVATDREQEGDTIIDITNRIENKILTEENKLYSNNIRWENCELEGHSIKIFKNNSYISKMLVKSGVLNGFTIVYEENCNSIRVKESPIKQNYVVGDTLDEEGLAIVGIRNDESEFDIQDGYICSPTELNEVGNQRITVTYGGKNATFDVNVVEEVVDSIKITQRPSNLRYFVGETLDLIGLKLTAKYNNGKEEVIENGYTCDTTELTEAGNKKVTITYAEKTATFTVTVRAIELEKIEITELPEKEYYKGDTLEVGDLKLSGINNDGSTFEIEEGYKFSPTVLNEVGEQVTITVSYNNKETRFNITVRENTNPTTDNQYIIEGNYVKVVTPNIDRQNIIQYIKNNNNPNDTVRILNKNGNELGQSENVGTGAKIEINGNIAYTIILMGDVDGNGKIEMLDLFRVNKYRLSENQSILSGDYFLAGDIDKNNRIDIFDIIKINNLRLK